MRNLPPLIGQFFAKFTSFAVVIFLVSSCAGTSPEEPSSSSSSSVSSASSSSSSSSGPGNPTGPEIVPDSIVSDTFLNPLYGNGADPWMVYFEGNYYLLTTTWSSQLVMRKSPTLEGLRTAEPVYVWSDTEASRCCQFWAFEFHRLNGPNGNRWYLMYTAGNSSNLDGQKLHVLESATDDPMGPYAFKRTLLPNRWNIDGTYLEHSNRLYLLWSEWYSGDQSMWIAEMSDPWTVNTQTIRLLVRPTHSWEQWNGENINEAPEILKHNGRTFMSFSAAPCHTPEYKLGLMELTGNDPLNPNHWVKDPQPVFQKANGVYGSGHNGFFKSPNGEQDWLVYHGNARESQGCGDTRSVRAQPISITGPVCGVVLQDSP